jgi:predicted nuclease of predicted toxin-antitoxin system
VRHQGIIIISKDSEFVEMVMRLDIPPQHLWVTCGNVTNCRLQNLLAQVLPQAQPLQVSGESVVEIADLEALQTT